MDNKNLIESFYSWYRGAIRHPKWRWAIILGTAFYLISPIDVIPELFPFVGLIDDGLLATLLVTELSSLAMDYLSGRKGETVADSSVETENGKVIDVEVS